MLLSIPSARSRASESHNSWTTTKGSPQAAQHALDAAVARALHWGASWADIGDALGITRQAAHRHYRHHRWDPDTQTVWTEPPLSLGRN